VPINRAVKKALKRLPVDYEIVTTKDHYFLQVEGHDRILLGGNHPAQAESLVRATLKQLDALKRKIENDDSREDQ